MIKLVLDTNVLVSSFMKSTSKPAQVYDLIPNERVKIYYSKGIIAEYNDVLFRANFSFDKIFVQNTINTILELGTEITPTSSNIPMKDETDRIFYDTAKEAEAYLVTGNLKHYPQPLEPFVLTPSAFLDLLSNE
ncbi:hypothetical protein FACS1894133_4160 [Clostridia bacterium]|nr:hypothetical protein FACS1894133_4160 [Clostridia bacterium]